ncbi:MAG: sugar nucleotide-binding protein [Candidatus Micrarchaeia archaeon]
MVELIIITGGSGRLGKELRKIFTNALAPRSTEMDITNLTSVREYLSKNIPDTIFHLAAITSIPECENKKDLAWKTNVTGTENLLNVCNEVNPNCYFIYISTACVFSGDRGFYNEDDIPYPKNYYGLTKAIAETAVRISPLKNKLIVRSNFVPKEKWSYEGAFIDRYGTYLFADDLAKALKEVYEAKLTGIVHITGDMKISMYELAKITTPNVKPLSYKEFEEKVNYKLTVDMSLDSKIWKKYKLGGK